MTKNVTKNYLDTPILSLLVVDFVKLNEMEVIKVISWNVHSQMVDGQWVKSRMLDWMRETSATVMLLQETGVKSDDDRREVQKNLPHYYSFRNNRQCTLVHCEAGKPELVAAEDEKCGEILVVKVCGVFLVNIYRQPAIVGMPELASKVLAQLPSDAFIILGGDLNCHFGVLGHPMGASFARPCEHVPCYDACRWQANKWLSTFKQRSMLICNGNADGDVTGAYTCMGKEKSCIDYFVVNVIDSVILMRVTDALYGSDHCALELIYAIKDFERPPIIVKYLDRATECRCERCGKPCQEVAVQRGERQKFVECPCV